MADLKLINLENGQAWAVGACLIHKCESEAFVIVPVERLGELTDEEIGCAVRSLIPQANKCLDEWVTSQSSSPLDLFSAGEDKKQASSAGHIYILLAETGHYKIGKTKNLNTRFKSISTASPVNVQRVLSYFTEDMNYAERYLHDRFKERRVRGEWFALTDDDIRWIESHSKLLIRQPVSG